MANLVSVVTTRKYGYGRTVTLADGRKGVVQSRYKFFRGQWRYVLRVQ